MDRLETPKDAVIDLQTAAIIEAHPQFPDAEIMLVAYPSGLKTEVHTHKLVELLLVRNSEAMAITNPEGGRAQDHYLHIADHFSRKTGFGEL